MAPDTLNRSLMIELIPASSCIASRVSRCSRRAMTFTGSKKHGIITSAAMVICQDR
jgi:hypothetical protein